MTKIINFDQAILPPYANGVQMAFKSMQYDKEKAARLIKEGRLSKGYTQLELAERSGIGLRSIQRIENGEVLPRLYTWRALAQKLDLEQDAPQRILPIAHNTFNKTGQPMNRQQRLIVAIGTGMLLVLAAAAYLAQAAHFPETTFELFAFWSIITLAYTLILFRIWK